MKCTGCNSKLADNNSLKCNTCESRYCLECLNFGSHNKTSEIDPALLSSLKCPSCTNVSQRKRGVNSPAILSPIVTRSPAQPQITIEDIAALLDQKLAPDSLFMSNVRKMIIEEVNTLVTTKINEFKEDVNKTTDYIMKEVKDLNKKIEEKDHVIQSLQTEQIHLKDELGIMRNRLSTFEKISRDRNIEIQAVPEDRSENVVTIFKTLCDTVNYPISDRDIQACRRVAKMDTKSKRPRNIVVTLSSPRMRDEIISATHRFNKEHRDKKLSSLHLGISGESCQVYVTEHLSPETKQLFAAVRKFAKSNNYAFSWVKFGQIYLRKTDKTNAILVKDLDILKTLK